MSETATFTYRLPGGTGRILIDEPERFLDAASDAAGVPVHDATGKVVGTFRATAAHVWDDATETPERDAADVARARDVMEDIRENGTIPWEQVKAELGI